MDIKNLEIDRLAYPELNLILWDTKRRYLNAQEAFETYEKRWRYVTPSQLTSNEQELIALLIKEIGKGMFLAA